MTLTGEIFSDGDFRTKDMFISCFVYVWHKDIQQSEKGHKKGHFFDIFMLKIVTKWKNM